MDIEKAIKIILSYFIFLFIINCSTQPTESENSGPESKISKREYKRSKPEIKNISANPNHVGIGELSILTVVAIDPEGDKLTYAWSSSSGTFPQGTISDSVLWKAPNFSEECLCKIIVSDGKETVEGNISIYVIKKNQLIEPQITNIVYSDHKFIITWNQASKDSFQYYKLYESDFENMNNAANIFTTTNLENTNFTVFGIEKNQFKYYSIHFIYSDTTLQQKLPATASSHDRIVISGLLSIDINGNWPIRLTTGGLNFKPFPAFDGSVILFVSTFNNSNFFIETVKPNGDDRNVIANNWSANGTPEFNFDASKVVYVAKEVSHVVCIVNSDGSNKAILTRTNVDAYDPHFSPDGLKIVYRSRSGAGSDIYLIDINGNNKTRLTTSGRAGNPEYSPKGDEIMFDSNRELYTMDIDGSDLKNISNQSGEEADAKFSPDGSKIVYVKFTGIIDDLYIMDSDGGNKQLLKSGGSNRYPRFSPDGSKIVFQSYENGKTKLYVINIDGSELRCLSDKFSFSIHPSFLYVE